MKVYLPLLILIADVIFTESNHDDINRNQGNDDPTDNDDDVEKKEWPEQSFDSSEPQLTHHIKLVKDPFWGHPLVNHPPWKSPEQGLGESRYPFHDPSYPIWLPGWKPDNKKKGRLLQSPVKMETRPGYEISNENDDETFEESSTVQKQLKSPINEYHDNEMDKAEKKQYRAEMKAGDMTRLLGTNQHRYQPETYRIYDLGRRFVPQYPYQEVNQNDVNQDDENPSLIPKQATPELVLAVAKESALIQAAQPVDPDEYLIKKDSLRTGNYWNAYWKEEVDDPTNALRSPKRDKLDTVTAKLSPGSPIYEYVSKLKKSYPKLLYVINKTE